MTEESCCNLRWVEENEVNNQYVHIELGQLGGAMAIVGLQNLMSASP